MLDGSESGEINALAITKEGEHFVTGGEDKKIKVWNYDEGISYYVGHGHSGSISKVIILFWMFNKMVFRLRYHLIRSL